VPMFMFKGAKIKSNGRQRAPEYDAHAASTRLDTFIASAYNDKLVILKIQEV